MIKLAIKKHRLRQGLTQKELAEISGISQSYISEIENVNSSSAPTLQAVVQIAKALKICPTLLLTVDCNCCDVYHKEEDRIKCKKSTGEIYLKAVSEHVKRED